MSVSIRVSIVACLWLPLVSGQIETPKVTIAHAPKRTTTGTIRVNSSLVLIPVTVTDPTNRFVPGLERGHFRVLEEDVEQRVSQFACEDAPMSLGIVFDMSGSMGKKLKKAREAVAELIKMANPEDEFFLVEFNERPELVLGLTRDGEEIESRLLFSQSKGRTALLDAIYLSLNIMKKAANPRRALAIISDGGDNASRYSEREIKQMVREADVQIYAMGIFEPASSRARTAEELSGPSLLNSICEQTGGRHFAVDNVGELPDIATRIANELHNHYVLGYSPQNQERDGKYRRVRVKLLPPQGMPRLRAYWRLGYYAPGQ